MRIRDDGDGSDFVLDLTPMIDVVFQLLIFFMLATTFLDPERQIDVELPHAESGGETEPVPDEIVLNVLADGRVLFRDGELDDKALLDLLRGAAQRDPETPVTIRGHRAAHHEMIVRVMDACGVAGLSNLAVGTTSDGQS